MKRKAGNFTDWLRNIHRQENWICPTFSGPFTKTSQKQRSPSTSSPNITFDIRSTDFSVSVNEGHLAYFNEKIREVSLYSYSDSGFRFFSMARSSVINPSRISSAKGMTSGRIKSTTNTTAAKASNFGKRSRDAYCINRSWIIRQSIEIWTCEL